MKSFTLFRLLSVHIRIQYPFPVLVLLLLHQADYLLSTNLQKKIIWLHFYLTALYESLINSNMGCASSVTLEIHLSLGKCE